MKNQDDDQIVPKPVFKIGDSFSSAYFGQLSNTELGEQRTSDDRKLIGNFIALLTDSSNREVKEDVLAVLRTAKAQQFLVDLLGMKEYKTKQKELVAACWESGLDFSAHLDIFSALICTPAISNEVLLEAITVVEEMQGPFDPTMQKNAEIEFFEFPSEHTFYPLIAALGRNLKAPE